MDAGPVLRYWTLQSPTGATATCDLVRTPNGLEVRCDCTGDANQARGAKAAPIGGVGDALDLAEAWKATYVAQGWVAREIARGRIPRRTLGRV